MAAVQQHRQALGPFIAVVQYSLNYIKIAEQCFEGAPLLLFFLHFFVYGNNRLPVGGELKRASPVFSGGKARTKLRLLA